SNPSLREPGALGEAFGLAGKLPSRRAAATPTPAQAPVQAPEPPEAAVQVPPPAPEPAAEETPAPARRADPPQPADDSTFQVSVYVLPDVVRALDGARRRTGRTNAELAYDALDAVRGRLEELVTARRGGGDRPAGSLFPGRRSRASRAAASADGRRRLWSMKATADELEVLDGLVEETGARSRSEVISCALEAVHGPRGRRRGR